MRRRGRFCKLGPSRVRKALYFPALTALRHNPLIQSLAARLTAARKPKMVIVGAAMRKLVHLVYGVLIAKAFQCERRHHLTVNTVSLVRGGRLRMFVSFACRRSAPRRGLEARLLHAFTCVSGLSRRSVSFKDLTSTFSLLSSQFSSVPEQPDTSTNATRPWRSPQAS